MLGGVAGGMADYFSIDPTIVRLAWAFFIFFGGFGVFLYIICWVIIPCEPVGKKKGVKSVDLESRIEGFGRELELAFKGRGDLVGGIFLILVGSAFLINSFFPLMSLVRFWPLAIIFFGLLVLIKSKK